MAALIALGAATLLPKRTVAALRGQKAEVDPLTVPFGVHARADLPGWTTAAALFEIDPESRWPKARGVGPAGRRNECDDLSLALADRIDLGAGGAVTAGLVDQ